MSIEFHRKLTQVHFPSKSAPAHQLLRASAVKAGRFRTRVALVSLTVLNLPRFSWTRNKHHHHQNSAKNPSGGGFWWYCFSLLIETACSTYTKWCYVWPNRTHYVILWLPCIYVLIRALHFQF